MRRKVLTVLAAAALAAGCGSDDEESGPAVDSAAAYDITVGEFIAELAPRKQEILAELVADTPECAGVKPDNAFVLLISARAIDAPKEAPLDSIVAGEC